ncbi:DUF5134 domain-containing protein [Actinomycetospora soli]|uniref:DUF5134 domain-containing protein n=1 Tax=Actinomycetospora soli TaxID=2893887 RepID=UPI001E4980DA|nr:DUF5134 domain-containing protein [Actinomycetospora soli]MCD2187358.1 DUF5134 domain-containing protein [Actinomycetospora soli]
MTGSPALDRLLLVALLAAAAVSAVQLVRGRSVDRYVTGRGAETGHLVMNLVMALMLTPWWTGAVRAAAVGVLVVLGLAFAVLLVRGPGAARPAHLFHLVAAGAMLYAELAGSHAGDMAGMDMADAGPGAAAWVLAVLFALDAIATTAVVLLAPQLALAPEPVPVPTGPPAPAPAPAPRADVRTLRVGTVPHVVMDVGMVAMLLATG